MTEPKSIIDGAAITANLGVNPSLTITAQAERAMGICRQLAAYIADPRDPTRVIHSLDDILRARVFAITCGYEDADDLDALRDRANVTQEELLSQQSEQLNKRLYFLSLVSAIFLPLGFLTGLLGVNIGGIPGADNTWAFATFCGILISLVALQMALFYRFKWL